MANLTPLLRVNVAESVRQEVLREILEGRLKPSKLRHQLRQRQIAWEQAQSACRQQAAVEDLAVPEDQPNYALREYRFLVNRLSAGAQQVATTLRAVGELREQFAALSPRARETAKPKVGELQNEIALLRRQVQVILDVVESLLEGGETDPVS